MLFYCLICVRLKTFLMLKIERYRVLNANRWDKFIHSSNNGTIFHLKQFLNYHPEERFIDHSLVIIKREKYFQYSAAETRFKGETLVSHPGSSVGSFVVAANPFLTKCVSLDQKVKGLCYRTKI